MLVFIQNHFSSAGSKQSVEEIYQKYKRLMFSTAGKYTKNLADQEDIVQTSLERLIKILSDPIPNGRCISAGYIVSIVRSVSIDFLRKQEREAEHCISLESDQLEQIPEAGEIADNLVLLSEQREQLWKIWRLLPREDRYLLEGKYILGYSDQQLAASLSCKPNSIRMKLTRARRRAMKLLLERRS